MGGTETALPVIRVAEPCTAPWDEMRGDDKARFCTYCNRHVHNLSAMTDDEVQRLVCDSAGRLCIRYTTTAEGNVATLNYLPQRARRGWRFWTGVGLVGALFASAANALLWNSKSAPPPPLPLTAVPPVAPQPYQVMGVMGEAVIDRLPEPPSTRSRNVMGIMAVPPQPQQPNEHPDWEDLFNGTAELPDEAEPQH